MCWRQIPPIPVFPIHGPTREPVPFFFFFLGICGLFSPSSSDELIFSLLLVSFFFFFLSPGSLVFLRLLYLLLLLLLPPSLLLVRSLSCVTTSQNSKKKKTCDLAISGEWPAIDQLNGCDRRSNSWTNSHRCLKCSDPLPTTLSTHPSPIVLLARLEEL